MLNRLLNIHRHLCVPQQLGNEAVDRVKVGLVFSGGKQVADHRDTGEELGDTLPPQPGPNS